jgi:hypothetical protein
MPRSADIKPFIRPGWILPLLLVAHGFLVLDASRRQSPPWDEIVYPSAGLSQWKTGRIEINSEHPILSKLICSGPLLFLSNRLPFEHASWRDKDGYRFGFQYTFRGSSDPKKIIFLSRLPNLFLSIGMCLLGYFLGRSLWGLRGGVLCLLTLSLTPILLSRASLALLEMPLFFFLTLTVYFWSQWRRSHRSLFFTLGAAAGGFALGCKTIAAPFLAAIVLAEFLAKDPSRSMGTRFRHAFGFGCVAVLTLLALYAPWKGGLEALRSTWLHPLSLTNGYTQFFFAGSIMHTPSPWISLAALAVKAPVFLWALALWGSLAWYRSGLERDLWRGLFLILGMTFLSIFTTGTTLSTVQLSPLYIALAIFASGIACQAWDRQKTTLLLLLFLGGGFETLRAHPNQLAFFNFLTGGPGHGGKWLADSDQDWGQSLPELAKYLKREGDPGVILCYSGPADPETYGIYYQDLLSPALVSRGRKNRLLPLQEQKVLMVIASKVAQSEPEAVKFLVGNIPRRDVVDTCFYVYDVSADARLYHRLEMFYKEMGRDSEVEWSREKSRELTRNLQLRGG